MRIKKFNAIAAVVIVGFGVSMWWGGSSLVKLATAPLQMTGLMDSAAVDTTGHSGGLFVDKNTSETSGGGGGEWMPPDAAVGIPFRNYHGKIPGSVTLKKWSNGDRVYYQLQGPINRSFTNTAAKDGDWGSFAAYEIFFDQGGGAYDQWMLNPAGSNVWHYDSYNDRTGVSDLPSSRYHAQVDGDQVTMTFWVHQDDTPANIVFNYNNGRAGTAYHGGTLSWGSTGEFDGRQWNHHKSELWRFP